MPPLPLALPALLIFALRVTDMSLDTVRTVDGQALVTSDTLDHATGGFIPRNGNLLPSVRH